MKRRLHKLPAALYAGLLLLLLPGAGLAGAAEPGTTEIGPEAARDLTALSPEELMKIEVELVYGASRFQQRVTEAPSSVSIVTSDEIRKYGYHTLADILRSLRGFYITYDRNYSYVGVRGFGRAGDYNSRILLLVDGNRINDNVYDSAPLGTEFVVDVDLIDRVEVIRGPGSSLYGNSAFFAVVNIITRRGGDQRGAEVSGETGSFETYKGRLTYGDKFQNGLEAFLSGSMLDSSGDRLFFREFESPDSNNGFTDHADFDRFHSALTKLSYAGFTLEGLYSSRTKGVPTTSFGTDFNDSRNRTTDAWWFIDLKYERSLGSRVDVMGRLFYDAYDYKGDYVYGGVVNKDIGKGEWWGGELQITAKPFAGHKLIVGSEYRDNTRQEQKNFDEDTFSLFVDDRRKSRILAFYVQDEFTISNKLILNAGIRYDNYSTFGNTTNPRIALIYTPVEKTIFKLLYGSAFRAPNVYELYYQTPAGGQKANPALGPETIKTYELIYEQYIANNYRGSVTGFYYRINDLISQLIDPADDQLVFRNIDEVKARGVEMEFEGKWENGLSGRISYSFQDAKDSVTKRTLVNSPRHLIKLNFLVPLKKEKVFLGLEEQFTSRRKTLAGNFAKSFYVTNLTVLGRDLIKNLEASASIYNLFDCKHGDPGGSEHIQDVLEQDGRVFRVKFTYKF
jgi:iron complex outermembrane receptor protein